jgi:hypothetical protein
MSLIVNSQVLKLRRFQLARSAFFEENKTVNWPTEFRDIVNIFKGQDVLGKTTHPAMYDYDTGAIVLAAVIGYIKKRDREVGSSRLGIETATFEGHKFGNVPLTNYIALIAVLHENDVDLLREGREGDLIRIFERYAAGGLEYLRAAMSRSSDPTGYQVLFKEVEAVLGSNAKLESEGLVDIFG